MSETHIYPNGIVNTSLPALRAGASAYYDGILGLVACKVERVYFKPIDAALPHHGSVPYADVVVTARHGTYYRKGERLSLIARTVVPKRAIRKRKYGSVVFPFRLVVEGDAE